MAGKKYWKISLVDMVITCENIGFITRGLWPLVINPIFSLVITITTRDIFQYFFPAIYYYLNSSYYLVLKIKKKENVISNVLLDIFKDFDLLYLFQK